MFDAFEALKNVAVKLGAMVDTVVGFPGAVVDFFTNPALGVGLTATAVVGGCALFAWFFPASRPLFGAIAMAAVAYAVAFAKGMAAAAARAKKTPKRK